MKRNQSGQWFRRGLTLAFVCYLAMLIRLIIFKYPVPMLRGIIDEWDIDMVKRGVYSANLIPFKTIKMYIRYYHDINGFDNLFGNILAFMPFGVFLPAIFTKMRHVGFILLHSFWLSLFIELFQLLSHFGEFDVDDILLNCFGALLGYCVYEFFRLLVFVKNKLR